MESVGRRRPILPFIAVILSVVLFACGGRGDGAGGAVPSHVARPEPAETPARPESGQPEAVAWDVQPSLDVLGSEAAEVAGKPETPVAADDAEPPEPPRPVRAPSGPRVYTHEDLAPYKVINEQSGYRENTVVADLAESQESGPPRELGDNKSKMPENEAEREKEILEVQDEMHSLAAELEYLQGRIPSLHNPFLPRAKASEADHLAEAGMDNAERLEHVKGRMGEIENRLKSVKLRYAELYKSKAEADPE